MANATQEWFETFFEEKEIDMEKVMELKANGTHHSIPVGCVYESILSAPTHEKNKIRDIFVQIDFKNGDVYHFITHLAQGLANQY